VLSSGTQSFSFEFMPPKSDADAQRLWRTIRDLERLQPTFVPVTYGAGGSTRDRTVRIAGRIAAETTLTPVGHLTAVGHSVTDLRAAIGSYAAAGVRNLLALRGDPPGDPAGDWVPHPEGMRYAAELVRLIKDCGDFGIGVAAFPEGHLRSPDPESDLAHFVAKCRAGADFAVTQMFFVADDYLRLRDRVQARGCQTPIIAGIMPISTAMIERMSALSGARLPAPLLTRLQANAFDQDAVRAIGIDYATAMCVHLLAEGVAGPHFYTLNGSTATRQIYQQLALAGRARQRDSAA
jgi:methylenetetrahydrofolate reductase (NADPH)